MVQSTICEQPTHETAAVRHGTSSSAGNYGECSEPWSTLQRAFESSRMPAAIPEPAELGLLTICRPLMARSVLRLETQMIDWQPVSLRPESFKPESFKPESFKPESFKPESFKPESFKPESFKPVPLDPGASRSGCVLELLVPDLVKRLSAIATRTIVLEMHAARLDGRLSGESPADRFQSYVEMLGSPSYAMEIFREYPALASRIVDCCRRWEHFSFEFLERLELDFPRLQELFGGAKGLGRLSAILGQGGDLHNGGRKVVICEFTCGTRLVYKPRSLHLEAHFQELLAWFHHAEPELEFRTLEVLNREGYGWVEYAQYSECEDDAERESFYVHLGGLLAILMMLQGNDMHHENIIACGPHPVLVDLETLFHPVVFDYSLASEKYSVLEVGILPVDSGSETRLSMSALGADSKQVGKYMAWNHVGTDAQRFEQQLGGLKSVTSRPQQTSEAGLSKDSKRTLLRGFRLAYRAIARHKDDFTRPGGLLDRFENDTSRCVLRPTRIYTSLLWDQHHPAKLSQPTEFLRDHLALEIPVRPYLNKVIESEATDLEQGDVPIFHCRPGDTDLTDCRGRKIADFFPRTALDCVKRRVEGFDESDLVKQEWLIRHALSGAASNHPPKVSQRQFRIGHDVEDPADFLTVAKQIGDFLGAKAIRSGRQATWAGYHRMGDSFAMSYLPAKLYSGQLGIVWFLAQLAEQTGVEDYRLLAEQGLSFFRDQQLDRLLVQGGVGAFDGLGGVIYVLGHLKHLWLKTGFAAGSDRQIDRQIERSLDRLSELIPGDRSLDVVSGSAGCLLALLGLHQTTGSARALDLAIACGESLARSVDFRTVDFRAEITWESSQFESPQTGFSHGLTGIALALARLSAFWRPEPTQDQVRRLIALEDRHFDRARGNWQDLRPTDDGDTQDSDAMWAWCHGAPGIAAGRHAIASVVPEELATQVLEHVDECRAALVNRGNSSQNNLCHGAFGNLDLLLSMAQASKDGALSRTCSKYMAGAVETLLDGRSVEQWLESNKRLDLMLGAAGIGYALLRQTPQPPSVSCAVPSILMLEAPATRGGISCDKVSSVDRESPTA